MTRSYTLEETFTMKLYSNINEANIARQEQWDPDGKIGLAFRGLELGGEIGEALNVIKKLERERMGLRGKRASKYDLANELADSVICITLIAMEASIELEAAPRAYQDDRPLDNRALELGWMSGQIQQVIAEYEWFRPGEGAVRSALARRLAAALTCLAEIARATGIDLRAAVVETFNSVSERVGVDARLADDAIIF